MINIINNNNNNNNNFNSREIEKIMNDSSLYFQQQEEKYKKLVETNEKIHNIHHQNIISQEQGEDENSEEKIEINNDEDTIKEK